MVQDMFQVAVSGWTLKPSVLQDWNVSAQYQRKMVGHLPAGRKTLGK